MPTPTFFNLPDIKREAIIKIAITEFADHDYESASITNMVKEAKIAKGSFYQYFADKKDLYLYLVDLATQQKIKFLEQVRLPYSPMEFFSYLRWLFSQSAQFDLSHPDLSRLINRAIYGDISFRIEVLQRTQAGSEAYIQHLVQRGINQGDINSNLSADLVVFVINTLANGLRYFIPQQLGMTPEQLTHESLSKLDLSSVEKIFDELILVLQQGISKSTAG